MGILTNRDLRFEDDSKRISEAMPKKPGDGTCMHFDLEDAKPCSHTG